jgi:hypothetical protein
MRKTWIIAVALLFVALTGSAQAADQAAPFTPEVRAAVLARLAAPGCDAAPAVAGGTSGVVFASKLATKSACSATANCATGTVSCNGNNSCVAQDRECPYEQGSVTCDGVTTLCPTDCCSTGTPRQRACCRCAVTGNCWDCAFCEYGFFPVGACP